MSFVTMRRNEILTDVLKAKRQRNDLIWITRSYHPKQAFDNGSFTKNPLKLQYKVLFDEHLHSLMKKSFPNESNSKKFLRLNYILEEIGYSRSTLTVRLLGLILIKIMKKIMQSILVTELRLLKVKERMGKNPVVFLPTHRSYADFILMAFLCFNYEIEIPAVIAGMDFNSMFGIASLLRQCGAIYMRRSFKDDKIYSTIFKTYVQTVIANGSSPFEFFIEGTRSRSGKSLPPKLGLLKMVLEAYTSNNIEDVTLVPVSISYDKLLEDYLFAKEVIGIPKPKESTTGLFRAVNLLEEFYGNVYIKIGEEISLRQFHKQCDDAHNLLSPLAYTITNRQQENTIITFFNIFAAVIICRLIKENRFNYEIFSLSEDISKLSKTLISVGACTNSFDNIFREIDQATKIHKFLSLNNENLTVNSKGIEITGTFNKDIFKIAVTVIMLQHYANPCYHFLLNPAVIILILRRKNVVNEDDLFSEFKLFRTLFRYEFSLFEPFELQDFQKALNILHANNITVIDKNRKVMLSDARCTDDFWYCILIPYLRGCLFICESVKQLANWTLDELKLKHKIRKQIELQLSITYDASLYYGLSSNFASGIFSSLIDADILQYIRPTSIVKVNNADKLNTVIHFLRLWLNKTNENIPEPVNFITCKL